MKALTLPVRGLRETLGFPARHQGIEPNKTGATVRVRFPMDIRTLDELETWLAAHPNAQMMTLAELPTSRRALARLRVMMRRYGVAMLIAPPRC